MKFDPLPDVPPEIENAAQSGELVVFVGAGISRLIGYPSWEDFADRVLEQLVPAGINYYELAQIKGISDPKKRLSIAKIIARNNKKKIDYKSIFPKAPRSNNIYSYLNSFNSSFVTTNYDKNLAPDSSSADPEEEWRFYKRDDLLGANLDHNGNVVHLHGCINDPDNMVITTKDYLDHYSSKYVQDFLIYLFEKKSILFLGYGLEEIEVLGYTLRRGGASAKSGTGRIRRFILQGFFNAEMALFQMLKDYFYESFEAELIAFPKDDRNYDQQVEILASWSKKLRFEALTLSDEVLAIEEEIRG